MLVGAWLREQAKLVEKALDAALPPASHAPGPLHEAMRYAVFGPGKRLRPALCLAAGELFGARVELVLPAAVALELVHTYSLVHDDLPSMDDDDLRRGRPTCHRVFGEALAVLAGDALLTEAFQVLADWGRQGQAELALQLTAELAAAAGSRGMAGGQALDLAAQPGQTLAGLEQVQSLKTGRLFRAAVRMGGLVGGADAASLAALDAYAHQFGLAFQIHDDVLDVAGSEAETGKRRGSDARQQRPTYVAAHGLAAARAAAQAAAEAAAAALAPFGAKAGRLADLAALAVSRHG